jgi:asparagine synthase (glutamine-hydrolysing)
LSKSLIAIHRFWNGQVLAPDPRERFARSLGIGSSRPAETCIVAETLAASTQKMRGWQPEVAPDGSHVLFAGYIDNRRALAAELGVSADDLAKIYACGLAAWGDDVDLRAIGRFSAIVISPDGEEIRLSRSPLAAPPLHYWHDQDRLLVSSSIGSMFSTDEVEKVLCENKLADSLYLNRQDPDAPWFKGVHRLRAGHRAIFTKDGIELSRYYDLANIPKVRLKSDRDYELAAMALFEEAVRTSLDGFSKPAISLSGGFDSQAVAALAVRCRPGQPLEAFTSVPEAGWDGVIQPLAFGDERPHVEALAAMYPEIKPHWVDAAGLFFEHKLEAMFLLSGLPPCATNNGAWLHEIYSQASASGCDVMLVGDLGNATFSFSGAGSMATMLRHGQWLRLFKEAGFVSRRRNVSRFRVIVSQAILPHAPNWLFKKLAQVGLVKIDDPFSKECPLNRDYAQKMDVENRALRIGNDFHYRQQPSTRRWRDAVLSMLDTDTADQDQAYDLLYPIAFRDPTAYRPLVEFCLGIPDEQYWKDGVIRRLARRILKGVIPDQVLDETREGLQCADWHLRLGRQRETLIQEIDRLAQDSHISEMLNLADFRRRLVDWPETPRPEDVAPLALGVTRGITTARYIRFVEGRNG